MVARRTMIVISLTILAIVASSTAVAYEIYQWLDENGVPNFSQEQPDGKILGVSKLNLVDTTPTDYDPDEDRYGIEAQAERMKALREEMEQRRDATREREKIAAQQQLVQYREPYRRYSHGIWFPPIYPGPPLKPEPPIEVPYPTSTLRPPGQ